MTDIEIGNQPVMPKSGVSVAPRSDDAAQGHWLLARLGKRVLRPGGARLTHTMLVHAGVTDADVVELAPGLGRTAADIIARAPRSYRGVERDPTAARVVAAIVAGHGDVHTADATHTGLPDCCADVVIGEAMLSMQGDDTKVAIITEACHPAARRRVLAMRRTFRHHRKHLAAVTIIARKPEPSALR
jgi:hypothetical protein